MSNLRRKNLYQDIYQRVHSELFEERVNRFILFHNRLPTPEEEGSLFEAISDEEIKLKFKAIANDYLLSDYTDIEQEYTNLTRHL